MILTSSFYLLKVEWLVKLKLNQNLGSLLNLNSIVILKTIST
jgi:hypothetical protein